MPTSVTDTQSQITQIKPSLLFSLTKPVSCNARSLSNITALTKTVQSYLKYIITMKNIRYFVGTKFCERYFMR